MPELTGSAIIERKHPEMTSTGTGTVSYMVSHRLGYMIMIGALFTARPRPRTSIIPIAISSKPRPGTRIVLFTAIHRLRDWIILTVIGSKPEARVILFMANLKRIAVLMNTNNAYKDLFPNAHIPKSTLV